MESESKKFYFLSLGCPKNDVDSELWINKLEEYNYKSVKHPDDADFLFVNTCAFIKDARFESTEAIQKLGEIRTKFPEKKLFMLGCWPQREGKKLLDLFPQVDGIFGNSDLEQTIDAFKRLNGSRSKVVCIPDKFAVCNPTFHKPDTFPYAFLKIAEGCDNHCSYCILPKIRGPFRSLPESEILRRAKFLIEKNYKELILIAQDITAYGKDLGKGYNIIRLLHKLDDIPGDFLIRIMYAHPKGVTPELIQTISDLPKIAKYLDIPFQHFDNEILHSMNRKYTSEDIEKIFENLNSVKNRITLRTTFIVGFPGEFDEYFEKLYDFISRGEFTHVGVFQYSLEEDTPASSMPNQIPQDIASLRKEQLEIIQDEIILKRNKSMVGKVFRALIERQTIRKGFVIARMEEDAPQIDRMIKLKSNLKPGEWCNVRLVKALAHEFLGIEDRNYNI